MGGRSAELEGGAPPVAPPEPSALAPQPEMGAGLFGGLSIADASPSPAVTAGQRHGVGETSWRAR